MLDEKYIEKRIKELCAKKTYDGLGLTMAQFFTQGEETPDLTLEQKKVLEMWECLSDKEKEAVKIYVKGIRLE